MPESCNSLRNASKSVDFPQRRTPVITFMRFVSRKERNFR